MHLSRLLFAPALLTLAACDSEVATTPPTEESAAQAAPDAAPNAAPDAQSLQAKLDAKKAQWAKKSDDTTKAIYNDGIAKVKATGVLTSMKNVGDTAPQFTLPNAMGEQTSSADLLEKGPIIVVFYRGAWCPYCNMALAEWQGRLDEIQALGAQLVTVSPQKPDYSLTTKEKNDLRFPVLSDVGNKTADAFGVTTQVTPEIVELWEGRIDMEEHNGDTSAKLPLPATYLIGTDGTIHFAHAHEDYRVRAEPDAVLDKLRELVGE